jgi:hypothetical protein
MHNLDKIGPPACVAKLVDFFVYVVWNDFTLKISKDIESLSQESTDHIVAFINESLFSKNGQSQ